MFEVRKFLNEDFWKFKTEKESKKIKNSRYFQNKIAYIESIEDIKKSTTETYARMFLNYFYDMENVLNKDLYEFNLEEIKLALKALRSTSLSLKSSVFYLVKNYIDWAYQKGYRASSNDLQLLEDDDSIITVNKSRIEKEYVSLEESYSICDRALHTTDALRKKKATSFNDCLVFLLIRYGFKGRKLCEIQELTRDMIDRENLIIDYYNKEEDYRKVIKIDEDLIYYIDEAYGQHGLNNLVEIKTLISLRRRLTEMQIDANCEYIFNINNIYTSKLIDELDKIYKENEEIMVEDVQRIKRFYEPNSSDSSYTSLKNFYSKLRDIEVKKADRQKNKTKIDKNIEGLLKDVLS